MNFKRKEIGFFLLYAFTIPLICVGLIHFVPACASGLFNLILFGIEAASPFLAALFTVMQMNGRKGLNKFISKKYKNNLKAKNIILAFLIPAAVLTMARVVTFILGYNASFLTVPSAKKLIIILWALIAEELGWRGYLQGKVEKMVGVAFTPLMIGIVWALWHYHFYIFQTMDYRFFLAFAYGCIAESYGYYVITKISKGNIVPASVWHFSGNLFFNFYLFNPDWNNGSMVPFVVANLFYSINIVIYVLYRS